MSHRSERGRVYVSTREPNARATGALANGKSGALVWYRLTLRFLFSFTF